MDDIPLYVIDLLNEAQEIIGYLVSSKSPDNHYPKPIMSSMLEFLAECKKNNL